MESSEEGVWPQLPPFCPSWSWRRWDWWGRESFWGAATIRPRCFSKGVSDVNFKRAVWNKNWSDLLLLVSRWCRVACFSHRRSSFTHNSDTEYILKAGVSNQSSLSALRSILMCLLGDKIMKLGTKKLQFLWRPLESVTVKHHVNITAEICMFKSDANNNSGGECWYNTLI